MLDHEPGDFLVPPDDVFDLGGVQVHAAHREHVVDPPPDPTHHLHEARPARARLARNDDPIPCPITDQWHPPATEIGGDQLAVGGHLEDELRLDQMHAVARRAAEPGRAKLGHAGVVERHRGVSRLDRVPGRRDARARLAGMDGLADRRR